ncbi:M14 family metallocarboxypeptidase [Photobacterium sp. WH77]|uniref:M14 family metallopeptidase n=1 Tax=unclassified Photobacterium TaxID=2628852 RepID=UPI001EDB9B89|nr:MULTISPECIES: M14 family metallocarboxypeptidase [unclassified Photobacterium]MCG2839152.1 M14 family metallocarboxypeptidase [Photobacterium sp. WH77]MCG2846769.1 M14 family metallocarboxypeptidase [Photobacterium sp. WH80]
MSSKRTYPIGTPGQKWTMKEKAEWLARLTIKRSYLDEVVTKIDALKDRFDVAQYGALSYDTEKYPLFVIKSRHWNAQKPTILITGGVHGYETSGVHGALQFVDEKAQHYSQYFNILVAPCVSPWGYETINRWNPHAIDPNRSFYDNSPAEESAALMKMVSDQGAEILAHIDLHETTDTDETEFRPALAARDGIEYKPGSIPDGFYVVGDTDNPHDAFQKAIIDEVRKVTHIAPPDDEGNIIGSPVSQEGVIDYPLKKLGLCAGLSDCQYSSTTEVYPDSPLVTPSECNNAQVAAIVGALEYILKQQ